MGFSRQEYWSGLPLPSPISEWVGKNILLLLLLLLSHFSRVRLCATPSLGFSRQEHWSGLPFPSPVHESEKWKWSRSVMSDSSRPHGLQPTRLLRPWDFPGKSTGVGCHCLLQKKKKKYPRMFLTLTLWTKHHKGDLIQPRHLLLKCGHVLRY